MQSRGYLLTVIGLVLLFTLMASAIHAVGVNASHGNRRHLNSTTQPHQCAGTDTRDMDAVLLTSQALFAAPQQLKSQQTKFVQTRVMVYHSLVVFSPSFSSARQIPASRMDQFLYAMHPRPPTALPLA
ncbi:MAG: hypothetical protein ACYDBB_15000 [Armatimonadota bacterium]